MKLTTVLCKQNYHRMIKRMWKKESKLFIAPLEIPPELVALGIKIHDAKDVAKEKPSYEIMPEPDDDVVFRHDKNFFCGQKFADAFLSPDKYTISGKKFYLFNNTVKITEDQAQALCLTKTMSYPGLPTIFNSLVGLDCIPNQDHLVHHAIVQALMKDGQLLKLPKYVNPKKPGYNFDREYGILYERQSTNLMRKLSVLCELGCGKYPGSHARNKILDAFSEVVLERGEDSIIFQVLGDILLTSKRPLKPFASPSEVEATRDVALPSIYPIKPTLDLEQSETSPAKHVDDIHLLDSPSHTPYHVHTLHILHKSNEVWSPVQKLSRAVVGSFTYAAQEARRLYGNNVKELPEPVTIQCVYSDPTNVGFLGYQLNTLDLSSDEGIKNQVWIDDQQPLCKTICKENAWKIIKIEDYNDTVFPKLLAMYLNGAHPVCV